MNYNKCLNKCWTNLEILKIVKMTIDVCGLSHCNCLYGSIIPRVREGGTGRNSNLSSVLTRYSFTFRIGVVLIQLLNLLHVASFYISVTVLAFCSYILFLYYGSVFFPCIMVLYFVSVLCSCILFLYSVSSSCILFLYSAPLLCSCFLFLYSVPVFCSSILFLYSIPVFCSSIVAF